MGMFDYLFIDIEMLPISDEIKEKVGDNPGWQTKSLDSTLSDVYITNEGELMVNFRYTSNEKTKLQYHGYLNFYTFIDKEFFEFTAKFTDGKLIEIVRNEKNM